MTEIFKMPDVGEGMTEGEIANWLVNVGDTVNADDPIAEIQNDKLLQEILSPYAGKVTKLFVDAGSVATVGDPLVEFDGDGSGSAAGDAAPAAAPEPAESSAPSPAAEPAPAPAAQETPVVASVTVTDNTQVTPATGSAGVGVASNGNILAMPSVREYARKNNVDLNTVTPTGNHGHITMNDVQNAGSGVVAPTAAPAATTSAAPTDVPDTSAPAAKAAPTEVKTGNQPMSPVRKVIAKTMEQQGAIPTVTNFDEVEVSKLVAHRKNWKERLADQGTKLTYLAYVAKALALTAKKYPEVAATVDMDKQEIVYYEDINMGIAVNTDAGLFVPNIKNADQKSVKEIADEIADLASKARDGKLSPSEMNGGAVTISNLGSARGAFFTPILNPGNAIILGLGSIVKKPVVNEEGEIVVGQVMDLSITYDHRLIDGMLAQTALNQLKTFLADPEAMLMEG